MWQGKCLDLHSLLTIFYPYMLQTVEIQGEIAGVYYIWTPSISPIKLKWYITISQNFNKTDFSTETATPFSCLYFKRRNLQSRAKPSPKKGWVKKADLSCFSLSFSSQIKSFFSSQIERWSGYRRPSQLHWGPRSKSEKWKEKESEERCEIKTC